MTAHLMRSPAGAVENGGREFASFVRNLLYLCVTTAIIVAVTYAVLAQLTPRYWAETSVRLEIGNPQTGRITNAQAASGGLAQELLTAQVQLLRSRDLARTVAQSLDLERRPDVFAALGGGSIVADVLSGIGLRADSKRSTREEQILEVLSANLSATAVDKPPTMTIGFTSGDPRLAAEVANAVAAEYVAMQRAALRDAGDGATRRLESEIAGLERRLAAIEGKAAAYRAGIEGLSGSGPLAGDPARQQRARAQLEEDLRQLDDAALDERATLASYQQRHREVVARRQSGFLPVEARILSRASPPVEPYFPNTGLVAALIGGSALLAMLVVILVRGVGRRRRRDRYGFVPLPEVVSAAPIRVAAARWDDDSGVRRMMPTAPTFADTEVGAGTADDLAAIARELISEKRKRIMVVSVGEEVGKRRPPTAAALARALARDDRRPVLVDLRGGGVDGLGMGDGAELPGFSDLLAGEASFGQVIFRDRKSRVHFIPRGRWRLAGHELADESVGLLVSALDHTYDHVLFDVTVDFADALGPECDAAVVATAFDQDDPRTFLPIHAIRAHSQASIATLKVDSAEVAPAPALEPAGGAAA